MTAEETINKLRLYDGHQQVKLELEGKFYAIHAISDVHNVPVIEGNSWSGHTTLFVDSLSELT